MPLITICYGILLVPIGLVAFYATYSDSVAKTGHPPYTALIPVALGILQILLGTLSYKPNLRKHTMHIAALLGLAGVIGPGIRAVPGLYNYFSTGEVKSMPALVGTSLTMVLSLVFLALCINSFIQARKRRKAGQAPV